MVKQYIASGACSKLYDALAVAYILWCITDTYCLHCSIVSKFGFLKTKRGLSQAAVLAMIKDTTKKIFILYLTFPSS